MITLVNKPIGMTPSKLMEELLKKNPDNIGKKYSFYGKLDPMADGLMIILWEDECRNPFYHDLEKIYETEIAIGITTDTGDLMGLITSLVSDQVNPYSGVDAICDHLGGKTYFPLILEQPYPDYSYLKIKGNPLWWWSQQGLTDTIRELIPKKTVKIEELELLSVGEICFEELCHLVQKRVTLVEGNFRQNDIIAHWKGTKSKMFHTIKLRLRVSNGTYIRHIASKLGGVIVNLRRTNSGPYSLEDKNVVQLP